jgi:hypothetical protein
MIMLAYTPNTSKVVNVHVFCGLLGQLTLLEMTRRNSFEAYDTDDEADIRRLANDVIRRQVCEVCVADNRQYVVDSLCYCALCEDVSLESIHADAQELDTLSPPDNWHRFLKVICEELFGSDFVQSFSVAECVVENDSVMGGNVFWSVR